MNYTLIELLKKDVYDKHDLAVVFSVSERKLRRMIEEISHVHPVISNSKSRGYKIATCEDDLSRAELTAAELKSRISHLRKRLQPLEKFINKDSQLKLEF